MDDPSHFLELRAKDGGWNREFQNFDELQEWAVAEQQAWSWIWSGPVTNDGALKSLAGHYKTVLGNIQNKISQWKPKLNDEESRQQAEDYLKEHYEAESIVAAESAKGVFIADLRDNVGPMAAAAAVAYWRGQSLSPTDSTQLRGAIEAALFSNEIGRTRSRVAEETMNDLLSRFGASLGEQETKQQTLFGRLEKALGNYSDLRDRGTRWFAARIGHYDSRIGDVAEDGRQRFSEVQKLFSDAMALRAPVSYWRAKQNGTKGSP